MSTTPRLRVVEEGSPPSLAPLRELYEKYGGSVYGRCAYLLSDRTKAEDAMQDVFAKALESYDGFRQEASPLTWLMKIATHHCLNLLRAERAGWRQRLFAEKKHLATPAVGPTPFELRDQIRQLLSRFDPETQAAAIHYHVDEMTVEEVAAALGRSVPTIRKRLEAFARLAGREVRS